MKRELAALLLGAVAWSGCAAQPSNPPSDAAAGAGGQTPNSGSASPAATPAADEVVATISGQDVTMQELQQPLVQAYGLTVLLELVQIKLAQQQAAQQHIEVTQQDIQNEITHTLLKFRKASHQEEVSTQPSASDDMIAPDERARLMAQVLSSNHITEADFNLTMEADAYLRRLVEPQIRDKLTDQMVHDRFNALYGEKARVRYIRLSNLRAVSKVETELKGGTSFEDEEKLHRYDAVGLPSAGELPPFSRQDMHYPAEFKTAAFDLKPGGISQPISVGDAFVIVQMIELIPPQHANFDDYKDSVRQDLLEETIQIGMNKYRQDLGAIALKEMEIKNPELRRQFQAKLTEGTNALRSANDLRQKLHEQQMADTTQEAEPATMPSALPLTRP